MRKIGKIEPIAFNSIFPYLAITLLYLKISSFRYISCLCMIIFLIIFFIGKKVIYIRIKYFILLSFFIIMFFISLLNEDIVNSIKNIMFISLNFAPIYIFDYFFKSNQDSTIIRYYSKKILCLVSPIIFYCIFVTLYYINLNPYIARNLANWDSSIQSEVYLPIAMGGGYALVYGLLFLPAVLLLISKKSKKAPLRRSVLVFISTFIMYFIIKSGFTTAFIISLLGVIIILIPLNKNKFLNYLIIFPVIILLFLFCLNDLWVKEMLNYLIQHVPNDSIIHIRLNEIIPVLFENNRNNSFGLRLNGIQKTLDSIATYPWFGVIGQVGFDYNLQANYLGLHSEWIDLIGKYGILMSFLYFSFLMLSVSDLLKIYKNSFAKTIIKVTIVLLFILGLFNPILNSSALLFVFVIIPSIVNMFFYENL